MHAPNMKEKTMRYPGHIEKMRMLRESGFFSEDEIETNFVWETEQFKSKLAIVNNTKIDLVYWSYADVDRLIESINDLTYKNKKIEELKFIHRLRKSIIVNHEELGNSLKKRIEKSSFVEVVTKYYAVQSNSHLQDAINMYNSERYACAMSCATMSLEHAIGALNSKNGNTNLKLKWLPKIFIDNAGYESDFLDRYLELQLYTNVNEQNIASFVEEKLELVQDVLSTVAL